MFIDVGGFKAVNDTMGHAAGDTLLQSAAERLQCAIRGSDIAARIGGDEFAILLVQENGQGAVGFATKFLKILYELYSIGGNTVRISASSGVSSGPEGDDEGDMLVKRADKATCHAKSLAKSLGKSQVCSERPVHVASALEKM